MNPPDTTREVVATPAGPKVLVRPRRYGRRTTLWVALVLIALALLIGWLVWRAEHAAPRATTAGGPGGRGGRPGVGAPPTPVGVATVTSGNQDIYIEGLGTVTPRATVTVHTRVAGQLNRVAFTEGQTVAAGELLAEVDPRPYQAVVEQAEGTLLHDQALLADARLDLERYQTLYAQDSIAKQTLDTQAALVKQYEGSVRADQGNLDAARVNLVYTRIVAPVAGRVGLRQVDPGNIVQPSDSNGVVIITQLQPIDVVYALPQDDIPAVARAMKDGKASVPVDALDRAQKTLIESGKLLTLDNQIDPTSGTVKLKATYANSHNGLFPNQFVNVRMLVDVLKDVTLVPVAAIQRGSQGTFAYVVKPDNTVTVRNVTIRATQGDTVSIASGLSPGEVVVTDGSDKLREGAAVEAVDRAAHPAGSVPAEPKAGGHRRRQGDGAAPGKSQGDPDKAPAAGDSPKAAPPGGN